MGAIEKQVERLFLLKKYYSLTYGLVGCYPGEKDKMENEYDAWESMFRTSNVCEKNYSDEIPYLVQKGYMTFKGDGGTKLYSITAKTVDLVEKAELGDSLEVFQTDFDKKALEKFKEEFRDQ